jgi:signal transduction histidine kinase
MHHSSFQLKKFVIFCSLIYLCLISIVITVILNIEFSQKKDLAISLKNAIHNSFLYRDFRTTTMILSPNIPTQFKTITISNELQLSEKDPSFFDTSLTISINNQPMTFIWSLFNPLLLCLFLSTLILIIFIPMAIYYLKKTNDRHQSELAQKKAEILHQLSNQVAHDIRSPLTVLLMITRDLPSIPEEERLLIRDAVNRIHDIANDLLDKNKKKNLEQDNTLSLQLIPGIIDKIITEKRIQYRSFKNISMDFSLTHSSFGLFSYLNPHDFKRILSNLINNSVESLPDHQGNIVISCTSTPHHIEINIKDNGKGIPSHILSQLGRKGFSFGKEKGHGLGLFHAQQIVQLWSGQLLLSSVPNQGTTVTIQLPQASPPTWFMSSIQFSAHSTIVILDDDHLIHHIWDKRIKEIRPTEHQISIQHFYTPEEVLEWKKQNNQTHLVYYLFDFEFLGHTLSGLDLFEKLGITSRKYLITSRHEDFSIQKRCEEKNILLLPKSLAEFIPINLSQYQNHHVDYVYIDDDELLRKSWERSAKDKGISLLTLTSPQDLKMNIMRIHQQTKIYIDQNLGPHELKGEVWAKTYFEQGFTHLYLATGYGPEDFHDHPWLKGVVGKEPPWVIV